MDWKVNHLWKKIKINYCWGVDFKHLANGGFKQHPSHFCGFADLSNRPWWRIGFFSATVEASTANSLGRSFFLDMNVTTTFVDENHGICKAQFNRMEHVWPVSSLACEWFILSNQNRNFGDEICRNRATEPIRPSLAR